MSAHGRGDRDVQREMRERAERIRTRFAIEDVIGRHVTLKRRAAELVGLCPFHDERSPSFSVSPAKGVYLCRGCGATGDVIRFVEVSQGLDFVGACDALEGGQVPVMPVRRAPVVMKPQVGFMPILPVPDYAPRLHSGTELAPMNPNTGRPWVMVPERLDAYRDRTGALLGYVARVAKREGGKLTPTLTWCIAPDGARGWATCPFPAPRPLMGLDALAAKPDATVLVVEGEKCRETAAAAFRAYAVVSWPGGGKGLQFVDWTPLYGRDVVIWPDADVPGMQAALGYVNDSGEVVDGLAQYAFCAGARRVRVFDVRDESQPSGFRAGLCKGWDVYDALVTERRPIAQVLAFLLPLLRECAPEIYNGSAKRAGHASRGDA